MQPRPRPSFITGGTHKLTSGCGSIYVTINQDEHGLFEVFSSMGLAGGCKGAQSEAIARLISLALRSGVAVDAVVKSVKGIRCPTPGFGDGGKVHSCPDAIAQALQAHLERVPQISDGTASAPASSLAELAHCPECPECGSTGLEFGEGCVFCRSCGFSRCG